MSTVAIDRLRKAFGTLDVLKEVSISPSGPGTFWFYSVRQVAENQRF
jgi:hypothetical protein